MCVREEGFLPSSALSSSNPIKALLLPLWGLAVLPSARPAAHLKTPSTTNNNCPSHTQKYSHMKLKCQHTYTLIYIDRLFHLSQKRRVCVCVASELTSHHHPGCWQPLLWPPGAWPPLTEPSALCLDNQSVKRQAMLTLAGLGAASFGNADPLITYSSRLCKEKYVIYLLRLGDIHKIDPTIFSPKTLISKFTDRATIL